MPSFDEVLAQPLDEIKTSLNGAQYRELQGFCSHVGVNAAGKQADLLARAIDYVEKLKSTAVHASPLKPCLKRASTTPTSAEPAGKFQELSPLPAVQPLPGFQPASDPKSAGQNTIIETISEAELDAAQGGFEAMEDDCGQIRRRLQVLRLHPLLPRFPPRLTASTLVSGRLLDRCLTSNSRP